MLVVDRLSAKMAFLAGTITANRSAATGRATCAAVVAPCSDESLYQRDVMPVLS